MGHTTRRSKRKVFVARPKISVRPAGSAQAEVSPEVDHSVAGAGQERLRAKVFGVWAVKAVVDLSQVYFRVCFSSFEVSLSLLLS